MDPNVQQMAEMAFSQTFSLKMEHVGKVSDLAQRLGKSRSEIVRRAIDLLYAQIEEQEMQNGATPA